MNLAPRKDLVLITGTTTNCAPNTYNIGECCRYNTRHLVPFLTTSTRFKPSVRTNYTFYDPSDYLLPRTKYGNSLQFTTERKTIVLPKYEYDASKIIKPRNVKSSTFIPVNKSNGKIAVCRMPFTHGYSAPSVPPQNFTGYDIDENNTLRRKKSIKVIRDLGPTTYNVPRGENCFNSIRYAGCTWSKSKTLRKMGVTNNNPGPTDYYPKDPKCVRYRGDFQSKPLMRKCCNVPRHICELVCKSKFEDLPAPGTYEIVDLNKIGKVKNLSLKTKPFTYSAARFQYKDNAVPGPPAYEVCDCFKLKRDCNIANVPFLHTEERLKDTILRLPGPADYSIKDADYHKHEKYIKKAAFNSTGERKTFENLNAQTPDPACYEIPPAVKCPSLSKENRSSVFKSMVCRFGRYKDKTDLSAGSYNIDHGYNYLYGDKNRDKQNAVAFNRTHKRKNVLPDFAGVFLYYGRETPGVGSYTLNLDCSCESKGLCFKTSPRGEPDVTTDAPGPGHYQLHPSIVEAFWGAKKTYNSRLMNNVVRRNPHMKGPKLNIRSSVRASRKKILRYFVKTGDFKHCW